MKDTHLWSESYDQVYLCFQLRCVSQAGDLGANPPAAGQFLAFFSNFLLEIILSKFIKNYCFTKMTKNIHNFD